MNHVFYCELPEVTFELNPCGFYILLINVNQGPPHLAIVFCNRYYSVTINSVSLGVDFQPKYNSLLRKNLPLLFLEIDQLSSREVILTKLNNVFGLISPLLGDGTTCLAPIKRSFEQIFALHSEAILISDLLQELQQLTLIKNVGSPNLNSGNFQLKPYSFQDVERHINSLLK